MGCRGASLRARGRALVRLRSGVGGLPRDSTLADTPMARQVCFHVSAVGACLIPAEVVAIGRGEDLPPFSRVESALVVGQETGGSAKSTSCRAQRTSYSRHAP